MPTAMSSNGTGQVTYEPIAITGMGCRFPGGVTDPRSFWTLLMNGKDAITEVPPDRWSVDKFFDPDPTWPGRAVTRWGGFLNQPITAFDADFFGISPREAAWLDPMQRWLLEVTWEALEDAGELPRELAQTATGVFIGIFTEDMKLLSLTEENREWIGPHTATGNAMTMASNRLSYWLDLRGPSIALDTACSSSLTAVHLACQSLWTGESALALAGGANAMFKPEFTIAESRAGMLSPDGRCKAFDARANGYVRGEGAGIVVLKPLSRALADGARIYATILATAVNQDGHSKGITVPNGEAQIALMREACARARITPSQIGYVEAHGTGTPVGDPIEAISLGTVLREGRADGQRCYLGSVKTNIGHLEAAAGVAGLMKAALCVYHRRIPAHLHLSAPNPSIPLDELLLEIPKSSVDWPDRQARAIAAVNSFGFGGANAHAIVSEPPPRDAAPAKNMLSERAHLLPLSAHNDQALQDLARSYRTLMTDEAGAHSVQDIVYSAAARRTHHTCRAAIVAHTKEEFVRNVDDFLAQPRMPAQSASHGQRKLVWVFSGMGPQWWGMGRFLLNEEPVFREIVTECDRLLKGHTRDWSLLEEMSCEESRSGMGRTRISQPANFALQAGIAAVLQDWGLMPDAIVGHSAGEIAAFYVAGALSLPEAIKIMYHRSRLQDRTTGQGKMLAVGLSEIEALERIALMRTDVSALDKDVSIAAINSPASVTLVGAAEFLEALAAELDREGIFARFLRVEVPFHSYFMDPLRSEYLESLRDLAYGPAPTPLVSTVSGKWMNAGICDPEYWWKNIRQPVRFASALESLLQDCYRNFLEIAPHPVLADSIRKCASEAGADATVVTTLRRTQADERASLLDAAGQLYVHGFSPDWRKVSGHDAQLADLPLYPWQRDYYWIESPDSIECRLKAPAHPLLGSLAPSPCPSWQTTVRGKTPFLQDHRVQGAVVYPGAAYVEAGIAALRHHWGADESFELKQIQFERGLFLNDNADFELQTTVHPDDLSFEIHSRRIGETASWTRNAVGQVARVPIASATGAIGLEALRERFTDEAIPRDKCYKLLRERGFHYGPAFQGVREAWRNGRECLVHVILPEIAASWGESWHMHPFVLDACFHALLLAGYSDEKMRSSYLPVSIGSVKVYGRMPSEVWAHARISAVDQRFLHGHLEVFDTQGRLALRLQDIHARSPEAGQSVSQQAFENLFYEIRWDPVADIARPAEPAAGAWLLLADKTGVADSMAEELARAGQVCYRVLQGSEYKQSGDGSRFTIDPGRAEHWQEVLHLASATQPCRGIVHLWSLDALSSEELDSDSFVREQSAASLTLLPLLATLSNASWQAPPQLWIVTRGAQRTGGEEIPVAIAQSSIWGFARTLFHQEHPELAGAIVDLAPESEFNEIQLLCNTLSQKPPGEDQFAFRGQTRLIPRLYPRCAPDRTNYRPRFSSDGAYLITGGFGGLGLVCARWLVDRGARHLILLSRTALPPRACWKDVSDPRIGERIAAVRSLEMQGASVYPVSADVANDAEASAWLAAFRQTTELPIRGVLHTAGVANPQLLARLKADDFMRIANPKVGGAWSLHHLLKQEPLDFFVLFSSIASAGVSLGMIDYSAANSFLDSFAHYRRALRLPATSISWGAWAEGMAQLEQDRYSAHSTAERGFPLMPPEMGIRALEWVLASDPAHLFVSMADWPVVARRSYATGAPKLIAPVMSKYQGSSENGADAGPGGKSTRFAVAFHALPNEEARLAALEQTLSEAVAAVLKLNLDRLSREAQLVSLGLDSMLALELRNTIHALMDVSPSLVEILNGATVASLAHSLLRAVPPHEQVDVSELAGELSAIDDVEASALLASLQA